MKLPLEITFRNVARSEVIEHRVRAKVDKLARFCDRITGCRVVIESPHNHRTKGNLFHVRVELSVPGGEIVVNRDPQQHQEHADIWVAIRDAFIAAQRQLQSYSRRRSTSVHERAVEHRL